MFNILYRGEVLYENLSHEKCAEILEDIALNYFEDSENNINPNEIELEEL
jgi:hypothetical protein